MRRMKLSVGLAVLALLSATLGCRLPTSLTAPVETPTPTLAPAPTAPPALDESVSALEQRVMAVYESARVHERVSLPLQTRVNPLDLAVETGVIPVERPGRWDERSFLVRGEDMTWIK